MKFKTLLLYFIFFSLDLAFGQDLIVHKNGSRIYCKIVQVDSSRISYNLPRFKGRLVLKRSDVESYTIAPDQKAQPQVKRDTTEPKLFFDFAAGRAIPLNDFGSKDLMSEKSGLALSGFLLHPGLVFKLTRNIGISASYHYQSNGFDAATLQKGYTASYPGIIFTCTSGKWIVKGFMAGLYFSAPAASTPRISFDLNLSCGIPRHILPELVIRGNNRGSVVTVTQHSSVVNSFAAYATLGLRYKLSASLGLGFHMSYLQSHPKFTGILTTSTNGFTALDNYRQKITTLNFHGSLFFILQNK